MFCHFQMMFFGETNRFLMCFGRTYDAERTTGLFRFPSIYVEINRISNIRRSHIIYVRIIENRKDKCECLNCSNR